MKTFSAKPAEVVHEWFVIDATDKVLGRVASEVALRLRGKHKPIYTPHVDTGDFIVIVNADKIRVTGNKAEDKVYYRHSGYPGGIYATKFKDMQAKHPGRAIEKAVKGMLPKGPLGYAMIKKLKVFMSVLFWESRRGYSNAPDTFGWFSALLVWQPLEPERIRHLLRPDAGSSRCLGKPGAFTPPQNGKPTSIAQLGGIW